MSGRAAATPARRAAFEVLRRVFEHGAWADRAFPAAADRHGLDGRERRQAQRLAFGSVQRRGTSDTLAERLTERSVDTLDPPVLAALRLGLFELLFSDAAAEHAAVDAAVELAKGGMRGGRRAGGAAGLVNAVLRRAATERDSLLASLTDEEPGAAAVAHSVPPWIAEMWWEELGAEEARALLRAVNEPLPTALRVNGLRAEPAELAAELRAAGEPVSAPQPHAGVPDLPEALVWDGPLGPAARDALEAGRAFAQSTGSQAVIALLDPQPGERVLDLCAGPGVKTTAIAARMRNEGELVAVERDPGRASQIEEFAERAGARVRVELGDAAELDAGHGYDRVLVDPPCSDLGTLASRPDARWRKDPATVDRLAAVQAAILARGRDALRPGGVLVYSTCTISRRENEDVTGGAGGLAVERTLRTRPDTDRTDGFFIARMRRDGA